MSSHRKKKKTVKVKKPIAAKGKQASSRDKKKNLIARWGNQQWKITRSQIKALSDASMSAEYDTSGKKATMKTEAVLTYPVYKALMPKVDIAREIWKWRALIKKSYILYVGGVAFGGYKKYQLVGVDVSDVELSGAEIVHCEIELTFKALAGAFAYGKTKRVTKPVAKKSTKKKKKKRKKR